MRHIAVVTSSRAEYGLLRKLLNNLREDPEIKLTLILTGSHLSNEFGDSKQEILNDGHYIDLEIHSENANAHSQPLATRISVIIQECTRAFSNLRPELLIILGDRFEIFASAIAATLTNTPIAHIHGGEETLGSMDNTFRNAISKMSHLHFTATETAHARIRQMGENPDHVFLVGGLGIDNILSIEVLSKFDLEQKYKFSFLTKNLLITYHPDSINTELTLVQLEELLTAVEHLSDTYLIFTAPNVDQGGKEALEKIKTFVSNRKNSILVESLGFRDYISMARIVDAVVGNSSSGLLEVPSLGVGTINVGTRQKGRESASSVINCESKQESISAALTRLYSKEFQESLKFVVNPYGNGGASQKIFQVVRGISLESIRFKTFFNILKT